MAALALRPLPEAGVSGGGQAAADSEKHQSPPGPRPPTRLPETGGEGHTYLDSEDGARKPRVSRWRPQPLISAGRKHLSGRVTRDAHFSAPSDLPGAGFPVAGSVGPISPVRELLGSQKWMAPNFKRQFLLQLFTRNAMWCRGI